eukprot:scaffold11783_cov70-Phaeocystis_antarctica.AAC.1
MRAAVAVWPFSSAPHRAVWPSPSSSSVLALARSSACTHGMCPLRAASMRAEDAQDGEVAVVRGSHERGVAKAALQVDTRTSFQQHRDDLKVAIACGGVQEGEGCGLTVTC